MNAADRITEYLAGGGLFNPEQANHDAVRDLLIDCRTELSSLTQQLQSVKEERDAALTLIGDVKTLPENTVQLLRDLNAEFYGAASAHADAFRILPKVADFLSRLSASRETEDKK